jgi:hypothetical protein
MFRRAVVCTTAVTAAALVVSCSGNSAPGGGTAAGSQPIPLAGSVLLHAPDFKDGATGSSTDVGSMNPGDPCTGTGADSGVAQGLAVAVAGAAGQNLANLPLGSGSVSDAADGTTTCTFTFAGSVQSGAGTYTIAVGSLASKTFTLSQLGSITIDLPS